MSHATSRSLLAILMLLAISSRVSAQIRIPRRPSPVTLPAISFEVPKAEVGVYGGIWNFDPSGPIGLGGRIALNRSEWLATEISVEGKHANEYGPAQSAVIVNAHSQDV